MDYKVKLKNVRMSPRKARLVANVIRGKLVSEALDQLRLLNKKAAPMFKGLIESAVANAQNSSVVDIDRLFVKEIFVDGGTTWKRYMPRAQGRSMPIRKRTAHFTVSLSE